jgi:hypothetical protein
MDALGEERQRRRGKGRRGGRCACSVGKASCRWTMAVGWAELGWQPVASPLQLRVTGDAPEASN